MFNKIRNLFKKPKPFIKEDWSNAKEVMNQKMKKEGELFGMSIYSTPSGLIKGFPKLTKSELRTLFTVALFLIDGEDYALRGEIQAVKNKDCSRDLLSLIQKGYIKRVKRSQYKLTFTK
jgi:hypothetical protein